MAEHTLHLNLGDNRWVMARCSCGWQQEQQVKSGQRVSDVVAELERDYERHAGIEHAPPYTPALPTG